MKLKLLILVAGIMLLKSSYLVAQQPKVQSPRLPANEFFVHPGESVYVGFPDFEDDQSNSFDMAEMPTLVDHPCLLATSLAKSVAQPLHLNVSARLVSKEIEPNKIHVAISRMSLEPRLKSFSAFEREFPLASSEGSFSLSNDFQYDLAWHQVGGEETKWAVLRLGKIGEQSLKVLIIIAAKPNSISDRLIMPETAVFSKVQIGVFEGSN